MMRARTLISTAAFALTTAFGVSAQAGVADLRYVFPLPSSVVFTAVDTMDTTVSGMPTGDSKLTTTTRSISELKFAPGDSGIVLTAALRSFDGVIASALGDLPMKTAEVSPTRYHIGPSGGTPRPLDGEFDATPLPAVPEQVMARWHAITGLVPLPGRQVRLGESWSDTARTSRTLEGLTVEDQTVTLGTYVADSVVDGRTINVLKVISESTTMTSGTRQGMDMAQKTTGRSEEIVLWDSTRHMLVSRAAVKNIDIETDLKSMNMTTRMSVKSRSIVTGEAQN